MWDGERAVCRDHRLDVNRGSLEGVAEKIVMDVQSTWLDIASPLLFLTLSLPLSREGGCVRW